MNERITILFEPLDVLLLRDHRPFEMGRQVLARSTFPQPSVVRGALRTALLGNAGADFSRGRHGDEHFGIRDQWAHEVLGGKTSSGSLVLRGPLLARNLPVKGIEPLHRKPHDLVLTREGWRIQRPLALNDLDPMLQPRRLHWGPTGMVRDCLCLPWAEAEPQKHGDDERLYLTRSGAAAYLRGDYDGLEVIAPSTAPLLEDRIGICRNPASRTAAEGMFYVKRCFRLAEHHGFAVEIDLAASTGNGWRTELEEALQQLAGMVVPLGGKAHRAAIRVIDSPLLEAGTDALAGKGSAGDGGTVRSKLWLQTPAPRWPGEEQGLVARVTARPALVGGFDLAKGRPRPLRRALPAGSVLYLDGVTPAQARALMAEAQNEDDRRAGYGVALTGRW